MFKQKKKKECNNVCVRVRKSFMSETLEYLKKLREEMESKQSQVA